jgi:Phage integrase, N-terminal SAM-like domain
MMYSSGELQFFSQPTIGANLMGNLLKPPSQPPYLLDRASTACRRRHFSPRTEESYRYWIKQYIYFHGKRHSEPLSGADVEAFLNHLVVNRRVTASTQTQVLNALVFLYDTVLPKPQVEV